ARPTVEPPFTPSCVSFNASAPPNPPSEFELPPPHLPVQGTDYLGHINIGILYDITGFPLIADPVDLGQTDNFSSFMLFAHIYNSEFTDFILGHQHTTEPFGDISVAH